MSRWASTYFSTKTRPNIANAVTDIAIFSADPTGERGIAVKRIVRYLNKIRDINTYIYTTKFYLTNIIDSCSSLVKWSQLRKTRR